MRKENVSSKTIPRHKKEECFERNVPLLNVIFYIGKGFMIRSQLIILIRKFYGINEHKANDMIQELLDNGLLIKKQATNTQTKLYIMTKFTISMYKGNSSTRDVSSIKLNNRKIWNNLYRNEFIIRDVIPMMENDNEDITIDNFFDYINKKSITIFFNENQMSIYQLYSLVQNNFDVIYDDDIQNGKPKYSPFHNDYYKSYADVFDFQNNFLHYNIDDDISIYEEVRNQIIDEKNLTKSPKSKKVHYYNLFNMVAAGFFFIGTPDENNEITIGTFDRCNNMYLRRIYENIICIFLMLERYLGDYPKIKLNVYMCDEKNIISLHEKEGQPGYDYETQEKSSLSKRDNFFKNMNVREDYWNYITVNYIYLPLKEKYNL